MGVYPLFHSFQKGRISIKPNQSKDGNDTSGNKLSDSVQDWMYFIDKLQRMADIDSEISGQVNHLNTINAQIKESEIKILNLEIQHSDLITSLNHIIFHANQFMNLLEHIVLAINDKITLQSPKALILLIYDFDHHDKEKDSK